jgi:2-hydroxycyclohexanecarboxyl-CoA dehydrogenase
MSSNGISLIDKTVALSGPFGLLTQSLTQALTENGADVCLLTDDVKAAQRFCQNITDLREMSEKYGRAQAVESKVATEKDAEMEFRRCGELFGATDIYIDTHLYSVKIPFFMNEVPASAAETFKKSLTKTQYMSRAALTFLRSRNKSRILYMFNEMDQVALEKIGSTQLIEFVEYVKTMAHETIKDHITFNAIGLGVTEEFLLNRFPKSPTIQGSLREMQKQMPLVRLVEYRNICDAITFMVSPLSAAVNGQVVRLNHGLA